MIEKKAIGFFKSHKITRITPAGYYIEVEEGTAFLPSKEQQESFNEGDEIEVFIYNDKEGHLTATLNKPLVQLLECEILKIKSILDSGAFADIGIDRDLFIPHSEQQETVLPEEQYPVVMYFDEKSERLAGSTKVDNFLIEVLEKETIKEGDEKELLIVKETELGFKAVFDKKYIGVLYHNELKSPITVGMKIKGFIKRHRDDGKVDLSLRKPGFSEILDAKDIIIAKLKEENDFLPYHDKTDANEIKVYFGISKRTFKAAVGNLMKEKKIKLTDKGIVLINNM